MTVGADGSIWTQANFSSYGEKSDVRLLQEPLKSVKTSIGGVGFRRI